ncbi:MAG: aspartate aminotransferase family protein [Tateyamaria sp.]
MTKMNVLPNSPEARDVAYHFHGYTNAARHEDKGPMIIDRGEGIYVYDTSGKRYIEALSGLWCCAVGFNEPRLAKVAAAQMAKLPFYHNFGHKSHEPAIDLAEKLISMAPVEMSKVFYTNSGSEANDTVLKMLWYRSNALGQPNKKKVIARQRGYHGVTIASGSLTGLPNNHRSFDLPIDRVLHTTCPHYWKDGHDGETEEEFASRCANDLETLIQAEGPDTIAAFFAEPVMGAGGVVVPPKTYWKKIQDVLNKHDILLVADEVICGFGRTGHMFGSETYGMRPDVMVMSKQLTSGYVPFSAFLVNERFYAPVAQESGQIGVLGHGFTGGSHPLGSVIALENLSIIEERGLVQNASDTGSYFRGHLATLLDHPLVGEVRGVGMIAAVELVNDKASKSVTGPIGHLGGMMNAALQKHGAISRNLGDAIAFCPPMITTPQQADDLFAIINLALNDVTQAVNAS